MLKVTGRQALTALGLYGFVAIFVLIIGSPLAFSVTDDTDPITPILPITTDVVDKINITVPVSCTLEGTGMTSHNATINNGTYTPNIGTTTITAYCNDNNGFAIYAAGYTGEVIGETNSNKLVGVNNSTQTIDTGTATSAGNPDVSNWAMKLTAVSSPTPTYPIIIAGSTNDSLKQQGDPDFSNYTLVPNEYTKVAYRTAATDIGLSAEGASLTTTYAAYISRTQPADTYAGKVIYTLVHPYTHNAPVYLNPNVDNISDVEYMQQFAVVSDTNRQVIIDSMVPEQQYTVQDSRDGKTYTIAKYQTKYYDPATGTEKTAYDVWMTKNLDLDLDSSVTYTNKDTDIGYNTTTGQYESASWTPMRSTYSTTSTHTHEWCAGGTWNTQYGCENNDTPESYDPGNLYWNITESDYSDWYAYYAACNISTSTPVCDQSKNPISTYTSSTGTTQYHLGNYYNWAAALATNDSSIYSGDDLVEQSICPAGWTLPRAGEGKDTFYSLWDQYGFASSSFDDIDGDYIYDSNEYALWTSPLYFTSSGFFSGVLGGVGHVGYFYEPVASIGNGVRIALIDFLGEAAPSTDDDRGNGNSVRCVARPVTDTFTFIQD